MASIIESISPAWAARRARARLDLRRAKFTEERLDNVRKRSFEGASGSRRAQWLGHTEGPAGGNARTLQILRQRSRQQRINNAHMATAVEVISANVVGAGIVPRIKSNNKRLAAELWRRWADTTDCDADGCLNYYALQDLICQSLVDSGEVLVRRRFRNPRDYAVPVQLQVIEPDLLADEVPIGRQTDGRNYIKSGIEFNRKGKRVAFHLYRTHPLEGSSDFRTVRVPAEEITHIFRCTRPGQIRGVPWIAPVLTRLALLDDYEDAALERARVSACFTAFVTDPDPIATNNCDPDKEEELYDRVEPGLIERLPPGRDVKFGTPPQDATYDPFVTKNLRAIASGMGITYEQLTGDLSGVNFSSGRMGWIEGTRKIQKWRWHTLIPQFCDVTFAWWAQAAQAAHGLEVQGVEWTAPRREMIDPVKETNARTAQVRSGFMSLSESLREDGYDPDTVLAEIAEDNKKLDALGLVLDSDARQDKGTTTNDNEENDDDEADDSNQDLADAAE